MTDLETSDLRADIGNLLVASFGWLDENDNVTKIETKTIQTIGKGSTSEREKMLAKWAL